MTALTKDQILKADDSTYDDVEIPEWGGTVRLKSFSGTKRTELYKQIEGRDKDGVKVDDALKFQLTLVAASIVNDKGEIQFSQEDVQYLAEKSSGVLDKLAEKCMRLNGLGAALDDIKENLEEAQKKDSG